MSHKTSNKPEFYVGYLPLPRSHKRFLTALVSVFVIAMLTSGALIAAAQRNPGKTDQVSTQRATWSGTVYADPYPMMIHDDGSIHLLIGIGKYGVADRVAPFNTKYCEVDGWALARTNRRAIQLDITPDAIRESSGAIRPAPTPKTNSNEPVELIGEIVDGKCFLGAMKPGDGKAHKACATLCIQGGLPPMFAASDQSPTTQLPLVLVNGSPALPKSVLKLVGEPIKLTATRSALGPIEILNVNPESIQRWSGQNP